MEQIRLNLTYMDDYSIADASKLLEEHAEQDVEVLYNSYGGSVLFSYDLAKVIKDRSKQTVANITGMAASMGAAIIPYFDKAKASSKAQFLIHPVSGGSGKSRENAVNDLYNVLASKVNEEKFSKIAGKSLLDVISGEPYAEENQVWLTAKEAKKVGLIDEIYNLDPSLNNDIDSIIQNCPYKPKAKEQSVIIMNRQDFKTNHSQLYNEVVNEGKEAAITAERKRIQTLNRFSAYAPDRVEKMIANGDEPDADFILEMSGVIAASNTLSQQEGNNEPDVTEGEPAKTESSNSTKESMSEKDKLELDAANKMLLAKAGIE